MSFSPACLLGDVKNTWPLSIFVFVSIDVTLPEIIDFDLAALFVIFIVEITSAVKDAAVLHLISTVKSLFLISIFLFVPVANDNICPFEIASPVDESVVVDDLTTTVKCSAASDADKTLLPGKKVPSFVVKESVPVLSDVGESNLLNWYVILFGNVFIGEYGNGNSRLFESVSEKMVISSWSKLNLDSLSTSALEVSTTWVEFAVVPLVLSLSAIAIESISEAVNESEKVEFDSTFCESATLAVAIWAPPCTV